MLRIDIDSILQGHQISTKDQETIFASLGIQATDYQKALQNIDDFLIWGRSLERGYICAHLGESDRRYLAACLYAITMQLHSYEGYRAFNRLLDKENIAGQPNPLILAMPHQEASIQALYTAMSSPNLILAKRLDLAYLIYQQSNRNPLKLNKNELLMRQNAIDFMKKVLQADTLDQVNKMMAERNARKDLNPEFIPGKNPELMSKLPDPLAIKDPNQPAISDEQKRRQATRYKFRKIVQTALEHRRKGVLAVNPNDQAHDVKASTIMLSPEQRDARRVIVAADNINNTKEYLLQVRNRDNTFSNCDTSQMISHEKNGFAAYTLNLNGELSLFTHNGMADHFAHSSMNAGRPVICAGEVKIANGKLLAITDYSGHYLPDPRNVYEALKYFKKQGLDISDVKIALFNPVPIRQIQKTGDLAKFNNVYNGSDFFKFMQSQEMMYRWQRQNVAAATVINKLVANERSELLTTLSELYRINAKPQGGPMAEVFANLYNYLLKNPRAARTTREVRDILRTDLTSFQEKLLNVMNDIKLQLAQIPGLSVETQKQYDQQLTSVRSISFNESYLDNYNRMMAAFSNSQQLYYTALTKSVSETKLNIIETINSMLPDLRAYKEERNTFFKSPNRYDRVKLAKEMISALEMVQNDLQSMTTGDPGKILSDIRTRKTYFDSLIADFILRARKIGIDTHTNKGKGMLYDIILKMEQSSGVSAPLSAEKNGQIEISRKLR